MMASVQVCNILLERVKREPRLVLVNLKHRLVLVHKSSYFIPHLINLEL